MWLPNFLLAFFFSPLIFPWFVASIRLLHSFLGSSLNTCTYPARGTLNNSYLIYDKSRSPWLALIPVRSLVLFMHDARATWTQ
jgi:hypothetical protein